MKITPEHVNSCIEHSQFHRFKGTTTTICCITLKNGHTVVGQSAFADPEEFNSELGQQLAYNDARGKIYALEAYLLSETMFHDRRVTNAELEFNERSTNVQPDELELPETNFCFNAEELNHLAESLASLEFPEIDPDMMDMPCNIEVDEDLPENTIEIHIHHHGSCS